jgi:acyl-CoA thioesterase-1
VVVVETGANDGLRGQSIDSLRANIEAILDTIDALDPRPVVFVAAMEALPNLGADYGRAFRAVYPEVASRHDAILLPFLLDGVAGVDSLNQADGIHPNPSGARRVAENVWRAVMPALTALSEEKR